MIIKDKTSYFNGDISSGTSKKLLSIILLIGFVLRFWGIWHGYPYSYYSDEAHLVKRALSFGSGDFNPHWFHKPAFLMYILFFEYGIFYIFGKILGWWQGVDGFAVSYIQNPGPFYMIGRVTTLAFSVGTIGLTYLTAKTLFDKKTALVSALILALSFGHILVSKDIKADTPCAFFTFASAYFMILYLTNHKTRHIYYAALLAGVGAATKYYSVVMIVPIFLALIFKPSDTDVSPLLAALKKYSLCMGIFLACFFICSPYNLLDPLGREIVFGRVVSFADRVESLIKTDRPAKLSEKPSKNNYANSPQAEDIPSGKDDLSNILVYRDGIFYYFYYLCKGMGFFALILSAGGIVYTVLYYKRSVFLCFYLFPLVFFSIANFMHPGYSEIRHQVVLYPFLIVPAGAFFFNIFHKLYKNKKILAYIFGGLLILPLYGIIQYNIYISKKDTRNLAKDWIETHIPSGTKLLMDEEGPVLTRCVSNLKLILEKTKAYKAQEPGGQFTTHYDTYIIYQLEAAEGRLCYDIREIRRPWWRAKEVEAGEHALNTSYDRDMGNPIKTVGVEPLEYYLSKKYEYAIINSYRYKWFVKESINSKNFPSFTKFYRELMKKGKLVKEFLPENNGKRPGPAVKIYKLPHGAMDRLPDNDFWPG